jgi:DNA polymerase III subunit delta
MMKFDQVMTDLRNKKYVPIYFLMGEEAYYIDEISDYIAANVLSETEKTFNQTVLYGKDTEIGTVINAAKRYPMMSEHQVIIVREAQNIKNIDELIYYVEKPLKSTLLVINYKYKELDKRKKLYQALDKNAIVFNSEKLYEDKIPGWISEYLHSKGYGISPDAAVLLTEFLGNDLGKIVNELNKLFITLPQGLTKISSEIIEKNIGFSKEYNNFELQKALATKDVLKANRIILHFAKNPNDNPFVLTISSLYSYFIKVFKYHFLPDKSKGAVASALKVHPFFTTEYEAAARKYPPAKLVQIISWLREYDLKSKGVGSSSASYGDLLKELVFKIIH